MPTRAKVATKDSALGYTRDVFLQKAPKKKARNPGSNEENRKIILHTRHPLLVTLSLPRQDVQQWEKVGRSFSAATITHEHHVLPSLQRSTYQWNKKMTEIHSLLPSIRNGRSCMCERQHSRFALTKETT